MIRTIVDLLRENEYLIGDEDIDIAKGKYEAPLKWSEVKPYLRRNKKRKKNA